MNYEATFIATVCFCLIVLILLVMVLFFGGHVMPPVITHPKVIGQWP